MASLMSLQAISIHLGIDFYGSCFSPDKKARIDGWIIGQPFHAYFEDAETAKPITAEIYIDWIHWLRYITCSRVRQLDRFEKRYRQIGLMYHKIPYQVRHSDNSHSSNRGRRYIYNSITNLVLARLSQILESDRPRSQQALNSFLPWKPIEQTTKSIMAQINTLPVQSHSHDLASLKRSMENIQREIESLTRELNTLNATLIWLRNKVGQLNLIASTAASLSQVDSNNGDEDAERLAEKFSREGSLFRTWIWTFPEVERGIAGGDFVEEYAQQLLEYGVDGFSFWTTLLIGPSGGAGTS